MSHNKYEVKLYKVAEVLADESFNCRGHIEPWEVIGLAKDIKERGLQTPITVQPFSDPSRPAIKYRVVAGHRRYLAFVLNKEEQIPAFYDDTLTETEARLANLRENLHRQDLNIKQEAHALKYFFDFKSSSDSSRSIFSDAELGSMFGQSRGWVQNRRALLTLPDDIQDVAAAGLLSSKQIAALTKLKTREAQYELVRQIKDASGKEEVVLPNTVKVATSAFNLRERKRGEILEMSGIIYDMTGPSLITRFAAWAAGEISAVMFMTDVKAYCEEMGIPYKEPQFVRDAFSGQAATE